MKSKTEDKKSTKTGKSAKREVIPVKKEVRVNIKILNSQLRWAVNSEDLLMVRHLLERGANVDKIVLYSAFASGNTELVDILVPKIKSASILHTILREYIQTYKVDYLFRLLKNPLPYEVDTYRLFIFSIKYGRFDICEYFLEDGVDFHKRDDYALKISVYHNRLDVFLSLVERGSNFYPYISHFKNVCRLNKFDKFLEELEKLDF